MSRVSMYHPKPVQVRLKPEIHAWVHAEAARQERSANWIINKALEEAAARAAVWQEAKQ